MFDSVLNIALKTDIYDINISLNHNISILTGESGEGKSHLVGVLNEYRNNIVIALDSKPVDMEILIFTDAFYPRELEGGSPKVVIIDDIRDAYKTSAISDSLKKNSSIYFLIVARDMSSIPSNALFSCFYDSVYYIDIFVDSDQVEHFSLIRVVDRLSEYTEVEKRYDTCIIEGSYGKAEYMFISNFFRDIRCCNGKANVVANLYDIGGVVGVIAVDLCAIGIFIVDIMDALSRCDCILINSPSFEYDLVYALSDESRRMVYDSISTDVIDGLLFENYFYHEFIKLRFGLCGKCSKSSIVKCLYNDCNSACHIPKSQRNRCNFYCNSLQDRLKSICSKSKALSELYSASKEV